MSVATNTLLMLLDALANVGSAISVDRSCRAHIENTAALCQIAGTNAQCRWDMRTRAILATLILVSGGCGDNAEPARLPLPQFVDLGGPKLAHPQVVFIYYTKDWDGRRLADGTRWQVTTWLETVGAEYGIGAGSVLAVEKTDSAPDEIDNSEIVDLLFAGLTDGSLPAPTTDTLYMFTFPGTTVTYGASMSCVDFAAYHDSARRNGVEVAYAVIPACGELGLLASRPYTIARELIAASMDPFPVANPGWQLRDRTSPWLAMGDDVSDLCRRGGDLSEAARVHGDLRPRTWSNAAAAAGQDPCVPHTYGDTYFNVVPDLKTILRIRPGEHQTIRLEGFSTKDVGVFRLSARPAAGSTATLTLGASKLGPGKSTTLDIALPSSAPIGFPVYSFVYSERDYGNYQWQFVPVPVMVGDPCSAFKDCLSCTARVGCGFCASSGRCEAIGASGSAESSCSGKSFATWAGSCRGFCEGHSTCNSCTSQPGCGWCAAGGPSSPCMEASHESSGPEVGACAYSDWSVQPSYCPGEG